MSDDPAKRALFEKVCIFVLGAVSDLRDAGHVTGDVGASLMPGAIGRYDQLKASGFRPTDREIELVMAAFARANDAEPPRDVIELIKRFTRNELPD